MIYNSLMQPKLNRSNIGKKSCLQYQGVSQQKFGGEGVVTVILTYLQLLTKNEIAGEKNTKIIIIKQTSSASNVPWGFIPDVPSIIIIIIIIINFMILSLAETVVF